MIVRDAVSIQALIENLQYQGHTMLWHLILYPVTKITRNPAAMQMSHLLIATLTAFVFLKFAPFSRLLKVLFIFGYFPFFEFASISRNYAIGILLLFIFCACFGRDFKSRNYIILSLVLLLMCQCNALSTVLAIALAATVFLEPVLVRDFSVYKSRQFYVSVLIFLAGLILSIVQMIPPADSLVYKPKLIPFDMSGKVVDQISALWNVFFPVPRIELTFWGSNFITYLPLKEYTVSALRFVASLWLLLLTTGIIFRKKIPAFYYIAAIAGVTAFSYIFYEGYLRHKAHYYFAFISALWISAYYRNEEFKSRFFNRFFSFFEKTKSYFLFVVLSLGVIAGLIANSLDYRYPFSACKAAAAFIKQNNLQNMHIAGHMDYTSSGVSAYLDKPFYYPISDRTGTFTVWNSKRSEKTDVLKAIKKYRDSVKADVLLVFNDPPKMNKILQYRLIPVTKIMQSTVRDENFFLYLMRYEKEPV